MYESDKPYAKYNAAQQERQVQFGDVLRFNLEGTLRTVTHEATYPNNVILRSLTGERCNIFVSLLDLQRCIGGPNNMYSFDTLELPPLVWGIDFAASGPITRTNEAPLYQKPPETTARQLLNNKIRELRLQEIENSREIRKVKGLLYSFAPEVLDQPASRIRALNEYL